MGTRKKNKSAAAASGKADAEKAQAGRTTKKHQASAAAALRKEEEAMKRKGAGKRSPFEEEEEEDSSEDSKSSGTSASSASGDGEEESSDEEERPRQQQPASARARKQQRGKPAEEESASSSGDDGSSDDDSSGDDESSDEEEEGRGNSKSFTDENADWLKPKKEQKQQQKQKGKQQLISSSDDDSGSDDSDDSNSGDDDDEDLLEVERQSRLLDAEMEAEKLEAEREYQQAIARHTSTFHLPTAAEIQDDADRVVPPSELRERIDAVLEVLADFKSRREPGRHRAEYISQLQLDMAELFGYLPELVEHFLTMFGPAETLEFLTASDAPRPLVIRTNTLKVRRKDLASSLLKRGVTLDPLAGWSKVGLRISESPVPVGATPEYLAGHYMLQSAASLCPVMALSPQVNDQVLDMSAAPGGKTSYLAQLMRNTGTIVANDLKPERQKATVANMHRLGVRNVITCSYDGRKLGSLWRNKFDGVLLDAPCSGLGVISRDPSVKVRRTMEDVRRTVVLQKEMLLSAIDALSYRGKNRKGGGAGGGGGEMVYSTCSVSVLENEEVINYVLSKRDVKVVDTGLDFGKPGFTKYQQKRFHPSLSLTRRFYPHIHNFDGFFVAKLRKLSDRRPGDDDKKDENATAEEKKEEADELAVVVGDEGREREEDEGVGAKKERAKVKGGDEKMKKKSAHIERDAGSASRRGAKGDQSRGKKRGKSSSGGSSEPNMPPQKKAAGGNRSVPPSFGRKEDKKKKKKKSTNAKMTKPRRMKAHG